MIGVIAAANTVPGSQKSGMTNAAAALAAPAISSVWTERPRLGAWLCAHAPSR